MRKQRQRSKIFRKRWTFYRSHNCLLYQWEKIFFKNNRVILHVQKKLISVHSWFSQNNVMLSQISYQYRDSNFSVLFLYKQIWVDSMSELKLKQLIIEITYWLKLEERDKFQTELIADHRSQLIMNEWVNCAVSVD